MAAAAGNGLVGTGAETLLLAVAGDVARLEPPVERVVPNVGLQEGAQHPRLLSALQRVLGLVLGRCEPSGFFQCGLTRVLETLHVGEVL